MRSSLFFLLAILPLILRADSLSTDYARAIKVTKVEVTDTTTAGQKVEYPKTDAPEVSILLVEIPPDQETGWHIHRMPCYAYILAGAVTVETGNGSRATFRAGQGFAEMVNIPHNGRNHGTIPVQILMMVTGEKGVPVSERVSKPGSADRQHLPQEGAISASER